MVLSRSAGVVVIRAWGVSMLHPWRPVSLRWLQDPGWAGPSVGRHRASGRPRAERWWQGGPMGCRTPRAAERLRHRLSLESSLYGGLTPRLPGPQCPRAAWSPLWVPVPAASQTGRSPVLTLFRPGRAPTPCPSLSPLGPEAPMGSVRAPGLGARDHCPHPGPPLGPRRPRCAVPGPASLPVSGRAAGGQAQPPSSCP